MLKNNDADKAAEYMAELTNKQGVAISSVKDGHIMLFKRDWLEAMLAKDPDKDKFIIFLQTPKFNN